MQPTTTNPLIHLLEAAGHVSGRLPTPQITLRNWATERRLKCWQVKDDPQGVFTTIMAVEAAMDNELGRHEPEELVLLADVPTRFSGAFELEELERWEKSHALFVFSRGGKKYTTLEALQIARDLDG